MKINTKILCKISLILNKMGISSLITKLNIETGNEEFDKKELVKELFALIIDNLYKAEEQIIELISQVKEISVVEAQDVDVIEFIKELFNNEKIQSFLKFA